MSIINLLAVICLGYVFISLRSADQAREHRKEVAQQEAEALRTRCTLKARSDGTRKTLLALAESLDKDGSRVTAQLLRDEVEQNNPPLPQPEGCPTGVTTP